MSSPPNLTTGDYQYQPLDHATQQIRLVTLLDPLENDDAIRLDIEVFEISEAPPYTALSYVWGPPSSNAVCIANGRLEIRDNLFEFLTQFRKCRDKTPSDQYLWIDQLCIDQSTTIERSHQVQMMSDIYSKATSIIAWLGDGCEKVYGSPEVLAERGCDKFENMYDAACVWRDAGELAAFGYILHHEYFTRLWIVQEFVLARQIRILVKDVWLLDDTRRWECGSEAFHDYMCIHVPNTAYNVFCESSLRRTGGFIHLDIWVALLHYLENKCADPHDKVYGLLGLIRIDQRVAVDYGKSTDQIYMEVALVKFRSRCLKNLAEEEAHYDSSRELLYGAACAMNITPSRWKGFLEWFSNIEHSSKLGRFHGHVCPITAMGLERVEKTSSGEVDQFWFDFQGKRHFIHCTSWWGAARLTDETKELLTGDWAKYVPQEHGDETS